MIAPRSAGADGIRPQLAVCPPRKERRSCRCADGLAIAVARVCLRAVAAQAPQGSVAPDRRQLHGDRRDCVPRRQGPAERGIPRSRASSPTSTGHYPRRPSQQLRDRGVRYADKYSQHYLSLMSWHGVGVPVDRVQAYIWSDLAAERGSKRLLAIREKMWARLERGGTGAGHDCAATRTMRRYGDDGGQAARRSARSAASRAT